MSRADDDSDDEGLEGLGSFRSMFREMPDEEPPQRGLAELMAAARVKAEEMAKPTLWERFVQAMRRPQVMALATIMILIGGAVFISQRKSEMDASPTASQPASLEEKAATPTAQTVATGAAGSSVAFGTAESEDKKSDAEAADQGIAAPADSKTDERQRAETDLLAKGARGDSTGTGKAEATRSAPSPEPTPARKMTKAPPKTAAPTKSPSKPRPADTKMSGGDLMLEGGLDDDRPTVGSSPGAGASAGGGGTTGGAKAGAATPAPTEAPEAKPVAPATTATSPTTKQQSLTVQQLHANAKKLAAAGDCAQVRAIAKQIAAKDAKYYRDNIAPDSTLATCLK